MNLFVKLAQKYNWLRPFLPYTNGFNVKKEISEAEDKDDVMGAEERFDWQVVKLDGDWLKEANEIKLEYQDWMDCTGHSIKNVIEMLVLAKFGLKWNISAAYINKMANTSKYNGNSMKTILETVRKYGVVFDEDWPEENRWQDIPQGIIDKGIAWTKEWDFGYDLAYNTKKGLEEALKYSPIYVAGYAWYKKGMLYYSVYEANHCFSEIKENQKTARDSYDPHIKYLAEDFKLFFVRRIFLGKKTPEYNKKEITKFLERGVKRLMRVEHLGEVWELSADGIVYQSKDKYLEDRAVQDFKDGTMVPISEKDFYDKFIK